jgi:hypothetical protein
LLALKLPSKKIVLIFVACAAAVGGVFFAVRSSENPASNQDVLKQAALDVIESSANDTVDSDNDGLKDWEETLWGTDPHKADTDGDGTPDGQEVKDGRNPLKANTAPNSQPPNDLVSST